MLYVLPGVQGGGGEVGVDATPDKFFPDFFQDE